MRLRTEGLTWREIDGETVLLDLHESTYLRANRAGTLLLRALVEGRGRDELVAMLASRYELEPEQAASDVDTFVAALRARTLLEE